MSFSGDLESIGYVWSGCPLHKMDRWDRQESIVASATAENRALKRRAADLNEWMGWWLLDAKLVRFSHDQMISGILTWLYGDFQLVSSKNGLQFWWFQTTSPPAVLTCGPQVRQRLHKRLGAMLPPEDWESLGSLQNKTMEKTHGVNPFVNPSKMRLSGFYFWHWFPGKPLHIVGISDVVFGTYRDRSGGGVFPGVWRGHQAISRHGSGHHQR